MMREILLILLLPLTKLRSDIKIINHACNRWPTAAGNIAVVYTRFDALEVNI